MEEKKAFNIVWISLFTALFFWLISVWNIIKLSTITHFIIAGLCTMWVIISIIKIKKSKIPNDKISYILGRIMLVAILWMCMQMTSFIEFGIPSQYITQKEYAGSHGYELDFFPESLPKEINDYEVELFPSILQGSGWMKVSFETDRKNIQEYKDFYSELAVEIMSAEEFSVKSFINALHLSAKLQNDLKETTIYIISDNKDWNHWRIECVIINEKLNIIQFFGM